jgi:hypothetical protein
MGQRTIGTELLRLRCSSDSEADVGFGFDRWRRSCGRRSGRSLVGRSRSALHHRRRARYPAGACHGGRCDACGGRNEHGAGAGRQRYGGHHGGALGERTRTEALLRPRDRSRRATACKPGHYAADQRCGDHGPLPGAPGAKRGAFRCRNRIVGWRQDRDGKTAARPDRATPAGSARPPRSRVRGRTRKATTFYPNARMLGCERSQRDGEVAHVLKAGVWLLFEAA